ncbi:MAG TPA: M23 family metallopeptidase [Gemmatimonadales bacterium]|nr:M23 family metallopeptidase [Gemmatimonadales bacterium]
MTLAMFFAAWLGALPAVGSQEEAQVTWRPVSPLQGSLVVVGVRVPATDSVRVVQGELAGEPLHFELIDGWFRAIGGVPIGARAHVRARVVIERAGGALDTLSRSVPVRLRRTPSERLRTDPAFVQPPESLAPRLQAERELVRDLKRGAHDVPRLWSDTFVPPRPGPVTSVFGMRRVFNGQLRSRHLGADYSGRRGDSVLATNRGVVAYVGDLYYNGTTVFLDHGAGLLTGYLHLSRVLVAAGDTVSAGQLIGLVGASGRVTGPHLHWFASYGDVTIDPTELLRVDLSASLP